VNGSIQLQFPSIYAPSLSSYDKTVSCLITLSSGTQIETPCTAGNNSLTIPMKTTLPKGETFSLTVIGIVNPNTDTGAAPPHIDILTLDKNGQILQYTNNAVSVSSTTAPETMDFTALSTSSTDLQTKSTYTFCVKTTQPIPIKAAVYIDFPQQFTLTQSKYPCTTAAGHSKDLLPYLGSQSSPLCSVTKSLRRIAVTGQTKAYAGSSTDPCQLCYSISNV
jgi:hypothetical protein